MKKIFIFCPLYLLFLLLLATTVFAENTDKGNTVITILGTSDIHGNIIGYAYEDNAETDNNGMARLYTYIQQVREENPNTILIDAGDAIQGTIMTDDIYNKAPDQPHPVIAAMNYMKYDVMTLGNHEFNYGVEAMKQITSQAEFPVLGANLLNPDGSLVTGNGWVIVERGGIKLAVIGVSNPNIPIWDGTKQGITDLTYEDASISVQKAIGEIGDQADCIIVSAHMGLESEFEDINGSDAGSSILQENPEVDLLQVAHMHIQVQETYNGKPVLGVRNKGREIARADITFDSDKNIISIETALIDMEGITPSEDLRSFPPVSTAHEKALDLIRGNGTPLGKTTAVFQPENEIVSIPEGKLRDTAVIDLISKIQLEYSGADVTATALFKDTSDLPKGDIFYNNVFDIYKYDNTLFRVEVTGKELKNYMEWSVEGYNQWHEGDINISFDPDRPSFQLDFFSGVEYEVNLSKPKGERIENLRFKGEPLSDDITLKLAVNNYRYSSTLKAENIVAGTFDWQSSNSVRDMIVEYLSNNSPITPETDNNWKITGVDLDRSDPRRKELIDMINRGLLPSPYNASYNLADYEELMDEAAQNEKENNLSIITDYSH